MINGMINDSRDSPSSDGAEKSYDSALCNVRESDVVVRGTYELHDLDLACSGVYGDTYHVGDDEQRDDKKDY